MDQRECITIKVICLKSNHCPTLFVCLFVCLGFYVPLENVSLIWRHYITGEGLHMLTNVRHSRPWAVRFFLACQALTWGIRL